MAGTATEKLFTAEIFDYEEWHDAWFSLDHAGPGRKTSLQA